MHFIMFVPLPFQNEKKFPFANIYYILNRIDVFSTEAYIKIFILSNGAVIVLEILLEIPPLISVIRIEGWIK